MPFGVAPNFIIDEKAYCVPMVIEESSVVAAASSAAKFWMSRGGFKPKSFLQISWARYPSFGRVRPAN